MRSVYLAMVTANIESSTCKQCEHSKNMFSLWKSVEASHWHVSIRCWVVGQRMTVFYRSHLFVSCHYFVLVESFYPFFPSHIVYGNEYVVSAHHSNSIKNIEYYMRILSRFIIISHSRQRIHSIDVDVKIALSIAAATTPLKDETFIVRSHLAHSCEFLGSE